MTRQRVALPSFREEGPIKPYDMRQLVAALEYRLQSLEDVGSVIPSTTVDGDLDNLYAPLNHTHVVADITDFDANVPSSIFDLDDVDGSPSVGETLIWDGNDFVPGTSGGSHTLGSHSDVFIPTPNDGEALTYVSSTGRWESLPSSTGPNTLLDLDDTTIDTQNQYDLLYNATGTQWLNTATNLQWNPVGNYLQLGFDHSINWRDSSEASVELLTLTSGIGGVGSGDPFWDSVVLLADFDGPDEATTYTSVDSTGHVATFGGNTQLDTAVKKFGTASYRTFGGVGDRLTFPDHDDFSFGAGNFTIECWVYLNSILSDTNFYVSKWTLSGPQYEWAIGYDSTNEFRLWVSNDGSTVITKCQWANVPALNTWHHVAATYDGTTYRLFVNGALVDSDVSSTTLYSGTADVGIGDRADGLLETDGWFDGVRITKGVARYTEAFTPPTEAHPIGNVGLIDQFFVGDPAYQTELDGTLIGLKNNIGVNWDNAAGDNVEHLIFESIGLVQEGNLMVQLDFEDGTEGGSTTVNQGLTGDPVLDGNATIAAVAASSGSFGASVVGGGTSTAPMKITSTGGIADPYDLSGNDYTIAFNYTSLEGSGDAYPMECFGGVTFQWRFQWIANVLRFENNLGTDLMTSGTLEFSQDYHVAVVKSGNDMFMFIDGVQVDTFDATSESWTSGADELHFGRFHTEYIDNVLLVKNQALWTANFTPPTDISALGATEQLVVGDPAYPTEIDGTLIGLKTDIGVNWDNTAGDNVELLTFAGVAGGDQYWDSVLLLCEFEGADAATTSTDESPIGHALTFNGTAQIDTANFNVGTSSLLLDGNSDYVSLTDAGDWDLGSGDWTFEAWVMFTNSPSTAQQVIAAQAGSSGTYSWSFEWYNGDLRVVGSTNGTSYGVLAQKTWTASPTAGQWYHVAFCRFGNFAYGFIDGVSGNNDSFTGTLFNSSSDVRIGSRDGSQFFWDGQIDSLRITVGVARYTQGEDFTPSTDAHPLGAATTTTFIAGDPLYDTRIDGVTVEVTGPTTVSNTLNVTGAVDLDSTLNVDGIADFNANVDINNGTLSIFDSTGADSAAFSHDGTDFNTTFTQTADWNISGLTGGVVLGPDESQPWLTLDAISTGDGWDDQGAGLTIGETGTKNAGFHVTYNGGTGTIFVGAGTVDDTTTTGGGLSQGRIGFSTVNDLIRMYGGVEVRDGPTNGYFRFYGPAGTDYATLDHDNDTLSITGTNSADFDVLGFTGEMFVDTDLRVSGDFTVSGTLTSINTSDLSIADNIIVLNNDAVNPPTENAGIQVYRGGVVGDVEFQWNETNDAWEFINAASETIADFRGSGTTRQLLLPQIDAQATPALGFGDGDSGFYEASDDQIICTLQGNERWVFDINYFGTFNSARPALRNITPSTTIPSVVPVRDDLNTGIGWAAADQLSLIAGAVEQARWQVSGNHIINSLLDEATGDEIALSLDYTVNKLTSGADTGLRLNVTETASPGTSLFAEYVAGGVTKFSWSTNPTFTMYDDTGADSAAFNHDGTDFITSLTNTTDYRVTGAPNFQIEAGTDTPSFLYVGPTVLTGNNADGRFVLIGENSSTLYGLELAVNSAAATLAGTTSGAATAAATSLSASLDINVTNGSQLWVRDAGNFRISDSTDADYADFSHDGTDFNTDFTQTTNWNITGLTSVDWEGGINHRMFGGGSFAIYDSDNSDSVFFSHTGTALNANGSAATTSWLFTGFDTLDMQDGMALRIRDAGDTDYAEFSHDGTDFNTAFTSTRTWAVSGLSLEAATGNETAMSLAYTVNKLTSGDDTGLLINKTDTLSQGVSRLLDVQVGGVTQFNVQDDGITNLGNFSFDTDQAVGVGQDNFVLTYDDGTGLISLEAAAGGSQTPWTSDIDGAGFGLDNIDRLEIQDAGGTDTLTITHDGADLQFNHTTTTDWDINGLGGSVRINGGGNLIIIGGGFQRIYSAVGGDYMEMAHDGTDFNLDFSGTTDLNVRDGTILKLWNAANTSSAYFVVNGTSLECYPGQAFTLPGNRRFRSFYVGANAGPYAAMNGVETETQNWQMAFSAAGDETDRRHALRTQHDGVTSAGNSFDFLMHDHTGLDTDLPSLFVHRIGPDTIDVRLGIEFRVYDSTNADFAGFSHDGTDFTADFTGTSDWLLKGLTGGLKIFDDVSGTDYIGFTHDGTDANILTAGTTDINVFGGVGVSIFDGTGVDSLRLIHDGTDFDFTFTGTTNADFTGATNYRFDGELVSQTYLHLRTATDTELNAIANAVNTDAGKVQGAVVYNTTTDNPVYATGNTDGAVWVDGAGTTVNTPV